jgi:replication factor C small subunit
MLYETYRPKSLADVLGQEKVTKALSRLLKTNDHEAIWLEGPSGTGKTSIALALASELGAGKFDVIQLDGKALDFRACQALEEQLRYAPWSGHRVVIVDESHAVTKGTVQWLLTALERIPQGTWWIFTTTETIREDLFGEFSSPLASRCKIFHLTNQGLAPIFARRAREIAQAEGLDGQPEGAYLNLVRACRNNMRAVLQKIEMGDMAQKES